MLVTNYLEEAERELTRRYTRLSRTTDDLYKDYIVDTLTVSKSAIKFYLPEGGYVLDEHIKGIENVQINLPYDIIVLEWDVSKLKTNTDISSKILTVQQVAKNAFVFRLMLKYKDAPSGIKWVVLPGAMHYLVDPIVGITVAPLQIDSVFEQRLRDCIDNGGVNFNEIVQEYPSDIKALLKLDLSITKAFLNNKKDRLVATGFSKTELFVYSKFIPKEGDEALHNEFSSALGVFLSFIEALSCTNVSHSKAPPRVRKAGEKGMFPKYKFEYKILTIDGKASLYDPVQTEEVEVKNEDGTVSKRTVVTHFRRDHIHRHPTKLGIIKKWHKPIIVNPNSPKGFLSKDYRLK